MIAALASALLVAAAPLAFDKATRTVTFTAKATGVSTNAPLEFVFVGPDSDRAYEALFVTDAPIRDLVAAFEQAGVPKGAPIGEDACRFWPVGQALTIKPDIWNYLAEVRGDGHPVPVWTGGTRGPDGVPEAQTNMPAAFFCVYSCAQSPILFDGAFDQSLTYGRYLPAKALEKGKRVTFTCSWGQTPTFASRKIRFEPGKLKSALESLRGAKVPLDVSVDFAPELTLREATQAAAALREIDSRDMKINGFADGQFFYRAFLPEPAWRVRKDRLVQPLEIRVTGTNTVYTVIDEDWSGEGLDPVLKPRDVAFAEAVKTKSMVCFIYAAPEERLATFYALRKRLPKTIRNYYLFQEVAP